MKNILVTLAFLSSTSAMAYEVTCTAAMKELETDRTYLHYDKTRSGATLDDARAFAEENVMEACSMDLFRFDLIDTHTCELISCDL